MDISISIVSYNTRQLLEKCITSIYEKTRGVKFEIIVVDNASSDGSREMLREKFAQVRVIKNTKNKFFSKANNQSLKKARGKYFLILNSDTYFVDNSLWKILDYMEKNLTVGAAEGLEMYPGGQLVPSGSLFSTPLIDFYELSLFGKRVQNKKVLAAYRILKRKRDTTFDIDVGCDAYLCVRTALMRRIGGYDPSLFLYYTENDLCLRIKKLGYKIL